MTRARIRLAGETEWREIAPRDHGPVMTFRGILWGLFIQGIAGAAIALIILAVFALIPGGPAQ